MKNLGANTIAEGQTCEKEGNKIRKEDRKANKKIGKRAKKNAQKKEEELQKKDQELQKEETENFLVSSASLINKNINNFKEPNLKNSNELVKSTKKSEKLRKLVNSKN